MTKHFNSSEKHADNEFNEAISIESELKAQYITLLRWALLHSVGELDDVSLNEIAKEGISKACETRQFVLHCHLRVEAEIRPNYTDKNALMNSIQQFDKSLLQSGADDIAKCLYELTNQKLLIKEAQSHLATVKPEDKEDALLMLNLMQSQFLLDAKKAQVLSKIHQRHLVTHERENDKADLNPTSPALVKAEKQRSNKSM